MKAVKNNNVIEQAGVLDADTPNSSHFGTNIMPPPIPTIDPISPAENAELANLCISGVLKDLCYFYIFWESEFAILLMIPFTSQKQAPNAARLHS